MSVLPIIKPMNEQNLREVLANFLDIQFLKQESRAQFSGEFALHNRFFSNGDRPLVALMKKHGHVSLCYDNHDYVLSDNDFVLFDDSIPHSWVMKDCELEIFYYRQSLSPGCGVNQGDFCLDNFF